MAAAQPLAPLSLAVDEVYALHDGCFAADKPARLRAAVAHAAAEAAAALTAAPALRAAVALLHGRALDALPAYSPEAEELLARAVKLDPANAEAWAALAHCFWKKRDYAQATACYEDSVRRRASTAALRALSCLARQSAQPATAASLAASTARAKEAVALGMSEPANWAVLGTAHLVSFFARGKDPDDLIRAHKAFARAAQLEDAAVAASEAAAGSDAALVPPPTPRGDGAAAAAVEPTPEPSRPRRRPHFRDPDMHFNRAQVLQYLGEFGAAQAAYALARAIDPQLDAEPVQSLRSAFASMCGLVGSRCGASALRVRQLCDALAARPVRPGSVEAAALAPRRAALLADLQPGPNPGVFVQLVCLQVLELGKGIEPPCFVVIDGAGTCACLSALYLTAGQGLAKLSDHHSVTIADPVLKRACLTPPAPTEGVPAAEGAEGYKLVQVSAPSSFLLNGEPLVLGGAGASSVSQVAMTVFDR